MASKRMARRRGIVAPTATTRRRNARFPHPNKGGAHQKQNNWTSVLAEQSARA
eukprot:CAMPEP_0183435004 /NCGR_PEP_ID=MMETSP0370-20130417/65945_1 /TAXON_ID=268820 /ORGANISM="Peridinium aciculiferum, Strain PAER-2" /LENGTH=52 /DNA_ID=CAMNT_0025621921 /DNA_START=46 /DNA_END=200 /DNA_ORIENTATION=-